MDDEFRKGGLRQTPPWRWALYIVAYMGLLVFLSNKSGDRGILWGGLIGGLFVVGFFSVMSAVMTSVTGRAFVLRHIRILLLIYAIGTVVCFIWDILAKK